jgi:hypothetical protein
LENQYKSVFSDQNMTQLLAINQTLSKSWNTFQTTIFFD